MTSDFQILYFQYVTSTQEIAKNILKENTVIVADSQKIGRGRFHRTWYSPPGGLWCTLILKSKLEPQIISLMAGVTVSKVLQHMQIKTCLKWPNDIIYKEKKLGGIIGEIYRGYILLGIGINLQNDIPLEIKNIAISIPKISRDDLLTNLLETLKVELNKTAREIIEDWKKFNCTLGKKVKIIENEKEYTGVAVDITEEGFLLVKSNDALRKVIAGDVILLK